MAKKITNINRIKGLQPGLNERQYAAEGSMPEDDPGREQNGTVDKEVAGMPVAANRRLPETTGAENQNADDDPVRGIVYSNNPANAKEINDDGLKPERLTFSDIVENIYSRSERAKEQGEEKLRKRHRAMTILGALNDGIAGFANILAARKGALPVAHDPVTRELDTRYQRILDERRLRRDRWDGMRLQAGMADLSQRLQNEREKRMRSALQKEAEDAHARELRNLYTKHDFDRDLLVRKLNFDAEQNENELDFKRQQIRFTEDQQNRRTASTNAALRENALIRVDGRQGNMGALSGNSGNRVMENNTANTPDRFKLGLK